MSRSLESALDEERLEVMNLLEGRPAGYRASSATPAPMSAPSPVPQVRSMLDIGPIVVPRHISIAGTGVGITPPLRSAPITPGMMGPHSPPMRSAQSASTSPVSTNAGLHRTKSDGSTLPKGRKQWSGSDNSGGGLGFSTDQFDMSSTVQGQALPKRNTQGGKRNQGRNSMASIIQGHELEPVRRRDDRGRHHSTAGIVGPKSKSPSSSLSNRSQSPGGPILNNNSFNPMPLPGRFVTDTGKVIDMNNAFRKLSDANLLKAGGQLSSVPSKDPARRARLGSGEALSPSGEIRLQKDYYDETTGEAVIQSSDENHTSDEEAWATKERRGRRRKKPSRGEADNEESENDGVLTTPRSMGRVGGPKMAKSLMAAAEEERLVISSQQKVKSLLEPTVTVTGPGGEKLASKRAGIHPNTNYNAQISGTASPATSDSEDLSDIRRAQRLSVNMSPVDSSIPHRVIRTIIRGEFTTLQKEAEEGTRRLRTYLVATDLSAEAAYALEWTIGTVLRDGDTILAVYAVDEEVGTGKAGESDGSHSLPVGQGGQAIRDTAAVVGRLTAAAKNAPPPLLHSPLSGLSLLGGKDSRAGSTDSRNMSKAEQERIHAIEDISATCIKLLRKTRLQVRIAVEVIHCKSPKYMITEAIDTLEPTLVILGSRGRSALKGVLLGSFSNYLVTKSSVPVMVARRKLQKPNSKNRLPHMRLANNLTPSKSLAEAKID